MIIYSTKSYDYMASHIYLDLKLKLKNQVALGNLDYKNFEDGERYTRILDDLKNKDVVLVGGTESDSSIMELYELACAITKYGASSLTLVIPYFGYSTMERAVKSGEIVGAKVRARMLSSIPQTPSGNKILLLDLHSEGIPYYFEGNTTVFHLYAKDLIIREVTRIMQLNSDKEFVLGSTDAGRAKWVESLANEIGIMPAFVYKRRDMSNNTKVTGINADVKDKNVIIYDDMIRSGGSLIQAGIAYKHSGAEKLFAIATHGVFPNQAIKKIKDTGVLESISVTDSHCRVKKVDDTNMFLNIMSVSEVFSKYLEYHLK